MKWCDLKCEYAEFPDKEAIEGACRTIAALYCKKHHRLVQKNAPCIDETKSD